MLRGLEYLDEALEEAESAARWYAERSASAAAGFADEIDAAIAAIEQNPDAWPAYDQGVGEEQLNVSATSRNWSTVTKIATLARSQADV